MIGRKKELTAINTLLADPNCRLVTIVGPGGIGKTRLAVEVGQQALPQFAAGVYFVSLASTDSVEDLLPRVAAVVDPETYPTGQTAANFLPQLHKRDPVVLLILDNLEQLLPEGNTVIEALLTYTQQLKLIVTSREALNLRWEWRYDLDGLIYPTENTMNLENYSAVEMFLQRLWQTRREPLAELEVQAAAQICRLVGGMPLGIELAAAQASRLSCPTIAQALAQNLDALVVSLRDLPARQRSLRASFEVTWDHLPPDEQAVFRRLSLFRSSFTTTAAQAVADAELLLLITLIDKSLLRQVSAERYDLHPVLRYYAQEKLAEVPEEQTQALRRYRDYYITFLNQQTIAIEQATDPTQNIVESYTEIDNLWAGWVQIMEQDQPQEFASALVKLFQAIRQAQFRLSSDSLVLFDHQQQMLERHLSEVDVCLIDVVWVDTLADHLLDLSVALGNEAKDHFSVTVHTNVEGQLMALPFGADVSLLYYRANLLVKYGFTAPPTTWDELEQMAAEIQAGERAEGRTDFWGFVWQGHYYEGLTCNALEWQASHGGGQLIEPDGVITVNNPKAIAAFERAARWVGVISPKTLTDADLGDEEATFAIWQAGNVAFMRHWANAFAEREEIDNPRIRDWLGASLLPSGGAGSRSTLGGQQIAVSKYARYPRAAIELVRYATSREAQLQRVISPPFYWQPTIPNLYDHPTVTTVHAFLPHIQEILTNNIIIRPSKVCGKLYPQVSKAYSAAVHSILTGQVEAATAVADLEARLVEITGFPVGRPE